MIADFTNTGKPLSSRGRGFIDFILLPAIVVVVGVAAFGLGRLSVLKETKFGLVIHTAAGSSASTPNDSRDQTH